MRGVATGLLALLLMICGAPGHAEVPAQRLAVLQRGINITNWFRYPPSRDPKALHAYLDDAAMAQLRRSGFGFVRLPVQPAVFDTPGVAEVLVEAVRRLERHGLAVIIALHAADWHLETEAGDRVSLAAFWQALAPRLRRLNPEMVFPEVLNEPVFADARREWSRLQHRLLREIRGLLPDNTVVLSGTDWGSARGLLALETEADRNVIYSFHLYEPAELTALGAYRPGLDSAAMTRLPFPATDRAACDASAASTADAPTAALMRFYCSQGWDATKLAATIGVAGGWARRNRVPLILGEFGASQRLNAAARLAWIAAVRQACEQQAIGWALWGYDDSMGFAVRPPAGPMQLDADVLGALGLSDAGPGK
jgi:endoglucanase